MGILVKTKVGEFYLEASNAGLTLCLPKSLVKQKQIDLGNNSHQTKILLKAKKALISYIDGDSTLISEVPVDFEVKGDFTAKVFKQLKKIAFGELLTYSQIAKKLNNPQASRAVGTACSKNRVLVFIPCHRVVPSNFALKKTSKNLGGFFGGLKLKEELINLELCSL